MGRVSQAVQALRQLSLPQDIETALREPRFWTAPCFEAFLELCDDLIFEDPRRGLAAARAAPRFLQRLVQVTSVPPSREHVYRAKALAVLGSAHRTLGQLEEAAQAYEKAIEISRQAGFSDLEMTDLHCRLAIFRMVQHRREEALELASRAVDAERRHPPARRQNDNLCAALVIRGIILSREGSPEKARFKEALRDLMEALSLCHPRRSPRVFYTALHNLALVVLEGAHRVEDLDAALRRVNEAQKMLRRYRVRRRSVADAKLRWIRALILARFGATQRAEQLLIDARQDLAELGVVIDVILISFDLADIYLAERRWGTLRILAEDIVKLDAPGCTHEMQGALLVWQKAIHEEQLTEEIIHGARRHFGYRDRADATSRADLANALA